MSLEERALEQFDRLHEKGDLLWEENEPRHHSAEPFDIEFRIATSLKSKPIDTSQKRPSKDAFADSHGDFNLGSYGPKQSSHQLILNKFCVVRPQFVLPTITYQPQSEPLNEADFTAAWEVLSQLGSSNPTEGNRSEYMVIFNCGVDGGSSVGHKHLQVIPKGGVDEKKKKKFFSLLQEAEPQMSYALPHAPFKHGALPIETPFGDPAGHGLKTGYDYLRKSLGLMQDDGKAAHNVLITEKWLLVIPRRKAWIRCEGGEGISCNSAGMVGMVWCWSEEQYEAFVRFGVGRALGEFGVPWE